MTALTKNTFTLPNLGTMYNALNKGSAKKAGTAQSTDGVLVPCQWDSLSDVRRHRPSKYVHQIRLVESTGALELRMMHFKAPKDSAKNQRIDASSAVMHSLRIERNSQGGVRLVRFGARRGADANVPVPFTQTLEGKMAQQFVSTFARGWVGGCILVKEGDGTSPIFDAYNVQKARHGRAYRVHEYYGGSGGQHTPKHIATLRQPGRGPCIGPSRFVPLRKECVPGRCSAAISSRCAGRGFAQKFF